MEPGDYSRGIGSWRDVRSRFFAFAELLPIQVDIERNTASRKSEK